MRASTVREPGDYAVRGGIIDLYAPGMAEPVRLDFFGDTLETIRSFDPESQRTTDQLRALDLVPVAEFQLTTETIKRFRLGYVEAFGAPAPDDLLYHAVSEGRRHPGMEHWLPLFHDRLDTIVRLRAGLAGGAGAFGGGCRARALRPDQGLLRRAPAGAQPARLRSALQAAAARPALSRRSRMARSGSTPRALARLTPFAVPEGQGPAIDIGTRQGRNFAAERAEPGRNVFEAVTRHVAALQAAGKRVVIALWSEGARERMSHVLADHALANLAPVGSWQEALALPEAASRARRARPRKRVRDRRRRR